MAVADREKMQKAIALPNEGQPEPQRIGTAITRGRDFLTDVRGEVRKVTKPSAAEVQTTTTVVIAAVFFFAAFFYLTDSVLGYLLKNLLHWLGGTQ